MNNNGIHLISDWKREIQEHLSDYGHLEVHRKQNFNTKLRVETDPQYVPFYTADTL